MANTTYLQRAEASAEITEESKSEPNSFLTFASSKVESPQVSPSAGAQKEVEIVKEEDDEEEKVDTNEADEKEEASKSDGTDPVKQDRAFKEDDDADAEDEKEEDGPEGVDEDK